MSAISATEPGPHPAPAAADADARWIAVATRDRGQDGLFVYAVRTTGVFCRPGCPSRQPKPENVVFYDTAAAACNAGFRPCRRCRPEEAGTADPWPNRIVRACAFIDACREGADGGEAAVPTLRAIADHVGVSPFHLQRRFKAGLGVSPRAYADARRTLQLRRLLRDGEPLVAAIYEAGYGAPSRVYERAAANLGTTPGGFRSGGIAPGSVKNGRSPRDRRVLEIRYTIADAPLGRAGPFGKLIVAATETGVCFVGLGDNATDLCADLAADYPKARIVPGNDPMLQAAVVDVLNRLRGRTPSDAVPLDIQATAFRRRVWEELQRIPDGEVRTYGEIARAIGHAGAARAVGTACARNPVAVLVPCHRAVRGDGHSGAYRWGADRKRALLAAEAGAAD